MRCSRCDHENPEEARFCNACGAGLSPRCGACQHTNPPGSGFCNACGQVLSGAAPVAEASAPERDPREYTPRHLAERILLGKAALEGERKHVTVLFADLADSTALAERVDAEEMHALMDRAFQLILAEVHRYEGTVNQFTGDGVMALFGAPVALEDAPRRAVTTALAIQKALGPLDADVEERHGRPFRMRIGINSGPVVVGRIGDDLRMDYTAVGDTTNLAARLEQSAAAGEVLISDATRRGVEGFFDLEAREPLRLKGKSEPVQAFAVAAERDVSQRIEAVPEGELTPYVGRDRELDTLRAAFASASEGRGQVVFLVGEAGLGKSRLLHEFRRSLANVPHGWFEARCASYARTTAFHAIADGLRRRVGIDDRDDEAAALAKLTAFEQEQGGDLDGALPYLRRLLSLPSGDPSVDAMDAIVRRSETAGALPACFLRAARHEPLVMVIEDLHWIDTASEEFLGFLADSLPAMPVLLVLTHRPGYEQPFGDRSYHVRIPLQALSEGQMAQMVGGVLDSEDLPGELRELIARKAEGNPLFVEELTRSLLEEGVLAVKQGRVSLQRELASISVPDRIQDVLAARLDRLPEEPKRAIQIASIIGREFALRLLARITEAGSRLEGIVGELRALELIYEKAAHPELAYMFKHALTHDVAYESMLVQRRKALHRIVGSAIEELYADRLPEHYEAMAHHFTEAEDWEQALRYHELASEKAEQAYANHAAIEQAQEALSIADRLGESVSSERRAALALRLARCFWFVSDFRASGDAFEMAAELSGPAEAAAAHARASFSFLWSHDYERSREVREVALEQARACGAAAAEAVGLISQDELNLVHGRLISDDSSALRAIEQAERSGDAPALILSLNHLTQRVQWRGDFRRAIELGQRAIGIGERENFVSDTLFGVWFIAIAHGALGEYGRCLEILRNGLSLCERIGDRALAARMLNTLGWVHAEFGCHRQAIEYNRLATEGARELVELDLVAGAPELYANAALNLAGNLSTLGETGAAAEQLARIEAQLEASEDPWMEWRYALHLDDAMARLHLVRGELDRGLERAERGLDGAARSDCAKLEARAQETRGRLLVAMDRREDAEAALQQALDLALTIEHPPVVWRSLSLLAEVARRRGQADETERWQAETLAMIERSQQQLPDRELQVGLRDLGHLLITDPLAAHR